MTNKKITHREGSLEAPTRHPISWKDPDYYDEGSLEGELERVFDICHGCRRCFNLCHSFPTLFDMVDESETGELDSVRKEAYWDVVEHCYLCDMCFMTKCPYVPPHEWAVDFPHLMLRAKAKTFHDGKAKRRDKFLSSTDKVGRLAGIPVVAQTINAVNKSKVGRQLLEQVVGIDSEACVPEYHSNSARRRLKKIVGQENLSENKTNAKALIFTTCYGNWNQPGLVEDLNVVFKHNNVTTTLMRQESCCGMPKLELGDLEEVERLKNENIEELFSWVEKGWDLIAPIPSCVLMFKKELPLLFPQDKKVEIVAKAFYDPFEYLMLQHKVGRLMTSFPNSLGKISYQVPCHLRVQNIGLKTRDVLELVPGAQVEVIERCSGHDGTYAVKKEYGEIARKLARPAVRQVNKEEADHFTSDCPMAAEHIASVSDEAVATNPMQLLRQAYGI